MIAGAVEFFPHRNSGCFTLPEAQVHGRGSKRASRNRGSQRISRFHYVQMQTRLTVGT